VFSFGKIVHSDLIFLKISKTKSNDLFFSFVVSSKVSKKAVVRNKLKRRARHITGKMASFLVLGAVVAVFFKKGADQLDFKELEKKLNFLYRKAGILQ